MPSRQEVLLDAAIAVIGTQGMRGLTHRAVDAAAGMPAGSTSNYFKTRDALVNAVVARFAARERAAWETIADLVRLRSRAELAAALTAYVHRAVGPDRVMTIARYSVFVEAALRPELQPRLAEAQRAIREWGAQWLRAVGSTAPEAECRQILDQLDGIILHQLAFPDPTLDLGRAIAAAVGRPGRPSSAGANPR
ncbi:TetR/AcrR family transcriptional regulator [Micromonospora sp. SL1-18]|uniref:TetR/AcrR family transcriptional regulator n=1 Tax=Micromonospora sp. SL1-18 TaxID=3399128 RepID=UPI003A4E2660